MTDTDALAALLQGYAPDLPHMLMFAGTLCLERNHGRPLAAILAEYSNRATPGPDALYLAGRIVAQIVPTAKG
jgi:hypothetical protein